MEISEIKEGMEVEVYVNGGYYYTGVGARGVVRHVASNGIANVMFDVQTLHNYTPVPSELGQMDFYVNCKYLKAVGTLANEVICYPDLTELLREYELMSEADIAKMKLDSPAKVVAATRRLYGAGDVAIAYGSWKDNRRYIRSRSGYWEMLDEIVNGHCLHVSPGTMFTDSPKVAFYESEQKSDRDICTVMTYGRYLKRFAEALPDEEIARQVNKFVAKYGKVDVKFSEDAVDFVRVIDEGPGESCMAGLSFAGHEHPAAVYASGDIVIAWTENDGRINSRTLINKSTRKFSRVYGDRKLVSALSSMGYEQAVGALVGCRLRRIEDENGNGYLMPYVDAGIGSGGGNLHAKADGCYWILNDNDDGISTYCGYENRGVTEPVEDEDEDSVSCDMCGESFHLEYEGAYTDSHGHVCDGCLDSHFCHAATYIGRSNGRSNGRYYGSNYEYVRNGEAVYVEALGEYATYDALSNSDFVEIDGDWYPIDDTVEDVDGELILADNAVAIGTDRYGYELWLDKSESRALERIREGRAAPRWASSYYFDKDGKVFSGESSEVEDWLDSDEDDEDYDPFAFVRCDQYRTVSEVVCHPEGQSPAVEAGVVSDTTRVTPEYLELVGLVRTIDPAAAEYMVTEAPNLDSFTMVPCFSVDTVFNWGHTPQGNMYWRGIHERVMEMRAGGVLNVPNATPVLSGSMVEIRI